MDFRRMLLLKLWIVALLAGAAGLAPATAQEKSVKPGINETWKSDAIDPLVNTLESESREIYTQRSALADLLGLRPGMAVADIGAGSGFMAEEFARRVGANGKVYAVDINAKLLQRIAAHAKEHNLSQIQTVLTPEDAVNLPAGSVDLIFVCDTYHHFEYPQKSLAGIHRALRAGGELILVEFHREPGTSPGWILEHVRAGQEEFTREIEAAGFVLVRVEAAPFLSQNYVLRFRKKQAGAPATRP
jgi:SAM-dependent methyltransferase